MSFTYDIDNLATDLISQIRFKTGLTSPNSLLQIQDEEIQYLLDTYNNDVNKTCLDVLNSLITRVDEFVDKTTGQVSEARSQLLDNLIRLRDDIQNSISRSTPCFMQFTGVFTEDMNTINCDEDLFHDGVRRENQGPEYHAQEW